MDILRNHIFKLLQQRNSNTKNNMIKIISIKVGLFIHKFSLLIRVVLAILVQLPLSIIKLHTLFCT
jgi:hypothetical protein